MTCSNWVLELNPHPPHILWTCSSAETLTWSDLVVVCSGPVWKDVFDLKELVRSVSSNDGEPKALGAFSEGRLQDRALQLGRISCEAPCSRTRFFYGVKKKKNHKQLKIQFHVSKHLAKFFSELNIKYFLIRKTNLFKSNLTQLNTGQSSNDETY